MTLRILLSLLGILSLLTLGCPADDDDSSSGDDDAVDDDAGDDDDDDAGDDDAAPGCDGVAAPGYAGTNGFHYVLADGADVLVENTPYRHTISSISSGLFVDTDNGQPPGTPVDGADYISASLTSSPFSLVTAGEQALNITGADGAALSVTVLPNFPKGANDLATYAVHASFPVSSGTINCAQAPSVSSAFSCSYEAVLVFVEQDPDTGDPFISSCMGLSGAFDTVLDPT
jgi:hypothetical protein